MLKLAKSFFLVISLLAGALRPMAAELSLDSERLNLEMRMQARVEEALGKILPAGLFVVVIRVEPLAKGEVDRSSAKSNEGYYLPGVPVRQTFDETGERIDDLVQTLKPSDNLFQRFIRRIQVTLVVDESISEDAVSKVRELTRQMLSLDPARGDTLDVQKTVFNKTTDIKVIPSGLLKFEKDIRSYWLLICLVIVFMFLAVFFLFMFGPLRGFLNNFVRILPTLKANEEGGSRNARYMGDMPILPPGYAPSPYGLPAPNNPSSFMGSLQVENPNKTVLPFGFIREDHLANLAVLLSRESPEKAAVVLGYLPSEWISRVLSRLEPVLQNEVASHLATIRQLLPEQVEDIEQDLKRRLDYLIGGPERIFAIYESLEPEAQKRMLDNLKESQPEIVEELRHRTLLFEDLERLETPALKALLREVDLQTIVMSLKGMADSFKNRILEHMSTGKAEIVKEELELGESAPGKGTDDAQRKMILVAKRLEREGQIHIPSVEGVIPSARYGSSLRSSLKLPPGMKVEKDEPKADIKEKIRKFMTRKSADPERYPITPEPPRKPPTAAGSGE